MPLIVRHWFASKKDSAKVFKLYSRIWLGDGYGSVEAIWMVMKSHHKTNIMINPHKNNAVFQQQIAYSREDIWMNLWGSLRDSSEAHDCIFIQTFCFSLIIIWRLEMAMRPRSYKVVCTFPEFFIQHCQLFSSKAVAGII